MKIIRILLVLIIASYCEASIGQIAIRSSYVDENIEVISCSFSEEWKFFPGEGQGNIWAEAEFDDSSWAIVSSLKKLSDQGQKTENRFGWYRKSIVLPDSLKLAIKKAGAFMIHLGRLASADEVYLNGKLVGKTDEFPPNYSGYNSKDRLYYVNADMINLNGMNQIAVKFYEGWSAGGFLGESTLSIASASSNDKIKVNTIINDSDYIFMGENPISIDVNLENLNPYKVNGSLVVKITTDSYEPVKIDSIKIVVDSLANIKKEFIFKDPNPGFFRYTVSFERNDELVYENSFNVGYEPEKIKSPIDAKIDFEEFWHNNLKELSKVKPKYNMILQPKLSKLDYNMYLVEMYSFDNELIRGYYAQPKRKGKFPVVVEYMGYGSSPYFPSQKWDGFAHFVLSIRGQALNKPTNRFRTWVTYGADSKDGYYYRGAFLDVVRALDFVCSRKEINKKKIAVRGGSQGGALSFVAAALDKRVKVAVPSIPFLSDYPDYFRIGPWPKSDFESYLKEHPEASWKDVYEVLSYFDIKNLAQWITCPLFMGIGVQDNVCPPHINFSAYNQVKSEKYWMACPKCSHSTNNDYWNASVKFIKEKLDVE